MIAGVEIVSDRSSKMPAPDVASALAIEMVEMVELGLSADLTEMNHFVRVFRVAPPLTITESGLQLGLELMDQAVGSVEGTQPLYIKDQE